MMRSNQNKEKLNFLTNVVSAQFSYSLSGYLQSINRKNHGSYEKPNMEIYNSINEDFENFKYIDGFVKMLQHKTADCGHQSLLLALILRNIDIINKEYQIFFTSLLNKDTPHTFLVLIPRKNQSIVFSAPERINFHLSWEEILVEGVTVIDPWQNIVFDLNLLLKSKPTDFIKHFDVHTADFLLNSLDVCFLEVQKIFKELFQVSQEQWKIYLSQEDNVFHELLKNCDLIPPEKNIFEPLFLNRSKGGLFECFTFFSQLQMPISKEKRMASYSRNIL